MLTANPTLIPGIEVVIGGETYTAARLNLGGLKAIMKNLNTMDGYEKLSTVFTLALKRNYPEATQPWLDETFEGSEVSVALPQVIELLKLSGLKFNDGKDAPAPGEAKPGPSRTEKARPLDLPEV